MASLQRLGVEVMSFTVNSKIIGDRQADRAIENRAGVGGYQTIDERMLPWAIHLMNHFMKVISRLFNFA